jgi:hypothetical protein
MSEAANILWYIFAFLQQRSQLDDCWVTPKKEAVFGNMVQIKVLN